MTTDQPGAGNPAGPDEQLPRVWRHEGNLIIAQRYGGCYDVVHIGNTGADLGWEISTLPPDAVELRPVSASPAVQLCQCGDVGHDGWAHSADEPCQPIASPAATEAEPDEHVHTWVRCERCPNPDQPCACAGGVCCDAELAEGVGVEPGDRCPVTGVRWDDARARAAVLRALYAVDGDFSEADVADDILDRLRGDEHLVGPRSLSLAGQREAFVGVRVPDDESEAGDG